MLENDVALYGEGNEGVLQARFFNEQFGDELVVTVCKKGHYGEEPLNKVIHGDGYSFKGSMIVIDGGDYVVRYSTGRDITEISGFEDMVKSAQKLYSWTMTPFLPSKGNPSVVYPDTTIVPGFDLNEPNEPDTP